MPKCAQCGALLSKKEFAASKCIACGKSPSAAAVSGKPHRSQAVAADKSTVADNTRVVSISLSEADYSFRKNPLDAVSELVLSETLLPLNCCICGQSASSKRNAPFLDPLPAAFWYVALGGPCLVLLAIVLAIVLPLSEAGGRLIQAVGGLVGMGAGLWSGQGALRRGRNVLTVYICDDHARMDKRLNRVRLVAKSILVLICVSVIAWLPMTVLAFVAMEQSSFATRIAIGAAGPAALLITMMLTIFLTGRLRRYRGLQASLREGKLLLVCEHADFAACVAQHHRTSTYSAS